MKTYTITITEDHLKLLSEITDKMARTIVGQLENGILSECKEAINRHYPELDFDDRHALCEQVRYALDKIHKLCWRQSSNAHYGLRYSEKSDTLWDMHEVFRHQLWEEREDKSFMTVDSDKPMHWNGKIPLIKINDNQ
jgi:hypothetical protein